MDNKTNHTQTKKEETMTKQTTWKKKNIPLVKFNKDKGQDTIEGIFLKIKDAGEQTDETTGEVRTRETAIFQNLENDEKFQVWLNAGLKSAMQMSDVLEGEKIRIVHLGKVPRGQGKAGEVNQYDIFTLN